MNCIKILITMLFISLNIVAQKGKSINEDLVLGYYGISLKNEKIGKYKIYGCGEEGMCAECYGYFDDGIINFKTTKFYVIDGKVICSEDFKFNPKTFNVLRSEDCRFNRCKYIPTYADDVIVSRNIYAPRTDKLRGFKHYKKQFFIKGNQIGFANNGEFHIMENSNEIDLKTFTPITNNFFYDKNGVYAITGAVSFLENGTKSVEYKKIQDTKSVTFEVLPDYVVINGLMYDYHEKYNFEPLQLDSQKTHSVVTNNYEGAMMLFEGGNYYKRPYSNYSFSKEDCKEEYQLDNIQCVISDLTSLKLLLDTVYSEYRYDEKTNTIYFDSNFLQKDLSHLDGRIYHSSNGFYMSKRFLVKSVKILNVKTKKYEDLDLSKYKHISGYYYCYKGVLYGNHSEVIAENVNPEKIRILDNYIFNDNEFISPKIDVTGLNLKSLKRLKLKNNKSTIYSIGDNFLIYGNKVFKNINPKDVKIISPKALKIKNKLIVEEEEFDLNKVKIPEIIFLD